MSEIELENMRRIIKLTLIKIGLRSDLIGFNYLCCAVELVIMEPMIIHSLCKKLYPAVAEILKVDKGTNVERSIRHSIEYTYINKGFEELNRMFGAKLYTIHDKPTAGELIRLVAEYYNLELYKNDPVIAANIK